MFHFHVKNTQDFKIKLVCITVAAMLMSKLSH